jgi:hypothetical protein
MIMAELREHPECEGAAVVIIGPIGADWDVTLAGTGATLNVDAKRGGRQSLTGFASSSI